VRLLAGSWGTCSTAVRTLKALGMTRVSADQLLQADVVKVRSGCHFADAGWAPVHGSPAGAPCDLSTAAGAARADGVSLPGGWVLVCTVCCGETSDSPSFPRFVGVRKLRDGDDDGRGGDGGST
jgi:hypothetical protein